MPQPIKILFIIPNLNCGGSERVVTTIVKHLDKNKFDPLLAVLDLRQETFLSEVKDHAKIIDLNCPRVRNSPYRIWKLIKELKPDIVFSTLSHLNLTLALIKFLSATKIKVIARESAVLSKLIQSERYSYLLKTAYKFLYTKLDLIICQSQYMKSDLLTNLGISEDKTKVIYNPVDIEGIRNLSKQNETLVNFNNRFINLVSVGRLSEEKGFDMLIKAIYQSSNKLLRLHILGSGPMEEELKNLIKKLRLDTQIKLLGHQQNPYPFISKANALILSSKHEGLPNVVLEALACGTPVISTPAVGGVSEILLNIKECLIVDEISEESLAKGLTNFNFNDRVPLQYANRYEATKITKEYELEISKHASL
jgi:glycosyltransferase involved in cell wall biosynthesis